MALGTEGARGGERQGPILDAPWVRVAVDIC